MKFHEWVSWMSALYRVQPIMFWQLTAKELAALLRRKRARILGAPC